MRDRDKPVPPLRDWGEWGCDQISRDDTLTLIRLNSYRYLGLHCGSPRSAHVSLFSLAILGDDTVQLAHDNSESLFSHFRNHLFHFGFLLWHYKYGLILGSFFPKRFRMLVMAGGWYLVLPWKHGSPHWAWYAWLKGRHYVLQLLIRGNIDNIDAMCGSSHCFLAFPVIDRWAYRYALICFAYMHSNNPWSCVSTAISLMENVQFIF